jgi:hypothetical protein
LIFWGGIRAVSKNTSNNGLKYITLFLKYNNHTNITLLTVTQWYDLNALSCVNNEVKNSDTNLMKYMKPDTHISILEVYRNSKYFTSHGLHLNGLGREVICNQNVSTSEKILQFKEVKPISMYWKVGTLDNTNIHSIDICRDCSIIVSKGKADTDCCSEKTENQEGTRNYKTVISDNSNPHHTLESQDTSTVPKINNKLTGSVANLTSIRPVT